ncbi:hypothetical protein J4416_03910 [Candidatus Pacearchaeota archaeon]|nr:hypothetical protein [Candidatus Pacearchaeota archaeon]
MKLKQICVQVKESPEGKMSIKICDMIDRCNCKKSDCCAVNKGEEDNVS